MSTITFRNATAKLSFELVTETCCSCGGVFAMPEDFARRRHEDGKSFYCPAGHEQYYTKSTATMLMQANQELKKAKERIASEQAWSAKMQEDLHAERKQHASTKGQLTKTRKRVQAGVCIYCHRHFEALERHMASKHGEASHD